MREHSPVRLVLVAAFLASLGFLWFSSGTSAADSEELTWGAMDPTWSPDGSELAFSLFASIWRVPVAGGEALQVSTSAGYHLSPAWSPKGDRIAFIRASQPPGGEIPHSAGEIALVNVSTGREEKLPLPNPAWGPPAWSSDGQRIVVAMEIPRQGLRLYEIRLADGRLRPLQSRNANWRLGAAWNWRDDEVYFGSAAGDTPQIWTIPAGNDPMIVQRAITEHSRDEILIIEGLAALPKGGGAVYAADWINTTGNYELYSVPRAGGKSVNLTNTARDEFSPAVSPDGTRIAHVSNHLGNIDLFVMPAGGGTKEHVRISDLRFREASGKLRVRVLDEHGKPSGAMVYVRGSDQKAYCPRGTSIYYYSLDPGQPREGFFVGAGDDTFPRPAGPVRVVVRKGIEYRIVEQNLEAKAGQTTEVTVRLERWTNWNQRGWYSGENHIHANYNGSYYLRPKQSLQWMEAMDLNAANMIVANADGAFVHDKEFFRGSVDPVSTPNRILYWGEEYRNSHPLGHMAFLNIKELVPPFYSSVPGSDSPYDYPLNTMAAQKATEQGGLVSYVHPIWGDLRDVFDTSLGAKESPVTAALGAMHSIDILPYGPAAYELWYRFLNAGFRISAGAGTDTFTNWRGINALPGDSRQYVEVGRDFTWTTWVERFREGRDFVTNAPLLTFTVNGQPLGAVNDAPAGQPYRARLAAEVTSEAPIDLVEFIQNGRVIDSKSFSANTREAALETEATVTASSWFAVRVSGPAARGVRDVPRAHSGPIYVHLGRQPVLIREDVELMLRWIDRLWQLLVERDNFGPEPNRQRASAMLSQARAHYQAKLANAVAANAVTPAAP
jgi:Tol biopolymer transport system component